MELDKYNIHERLINRKFFIGKYELVTILNSTFYNTKNIIKNYDFAIHSNSDKNNMNPLIWEFGHFLYFWEYLVIKNLDYHINYEYKLKKEYYDSFLLSKENRYFYINKLLNKNELIKIMDNIQNIMLDVLEKCYTTINIYLIYLGFSHQQMHNESFLYTMNQLDVHFDFVNKYDYKEDIYKSIEMIEIKGGDIFKELLIINNFILIMNIHLLKQQLITFL